MEITKEEAYQRVKDLIVSNVAQDLWNQISLKGHPSHRIIGSFRQHLFLYSLPKEETGLETKINYIKFRERYPEDCDLHLGVLVDCLKAGFKI